MAVDPISDPLTSAAARVARRLRAAGGIKTGPLGPSPTSASADEIHLGEFQRRMDALEAALVEVQRQRLDLVATEVEQRAKAVFNVMAQPVLAQLTQHDAQRERELATAMRRVDQLEQALRSHRAAVAHTSQALNRSFQGARGEMVIGIAVAVVTLSVGCAALFVR